MGTARPAGVDRHPEPPGPATETGEGNPVARPGHGQPLHLVAIGSPVGPPHRSPPDKTLAQRGDSSSGPFPWHAELLWPLATI